MEPVKKLKIVAVIAVVFGLMTVFSAGRVLFGGQEAQASMGNAVPFVLWFNFVAGFAYVFTGAGLWRRAPWAKYAAAGIAATTALVTVAFVAHIMQGAPYEVRTAAALALRLFLWTVAAAMVWRAGPWR